MSMKPMFALVLSLVAAISTAAQATNLLAPSIAPGLELEAENEAHVVRGVRAGSGSTAIIWTSEQLFLTDDRGSSWRPVEPAIGRFGRIISADLPSPRDLSVVILQSDGRLRIESSKDAGLNWSKQPVDLPGSERLGIALTSGTLRTVGGTRFLEFQIETSSAFTGQAAYRQQADGRWVLDSSSVDLNRDDADSTGQSSYGWTLENIGRCYGFKSGCMTETRVMYNESDVTPSEIRSLTDTARLSVQAEAVPRFALPPGGAVRISLNRGFDKCTAAPASQMQTWWDTSWFYDVNIYMSGRNRGCSQPQLTAAWVDQVSAMGWGLIPTIVGYQSPCTASATSQKLSYDPVVAEQQGRGEADIAVADAINLGLTQGSVLYYDMERYDETAQTPGCRTATVAFLRGWTDRVKQLGYISGTYGSPTNAVADWIAIPEASRMDAVWLARWDNVMSVWSYASPSPVVPTNVWNNHQRIKQWQAPHNETWGGITFNIDGNIADGPVAGVAVPRNRNADFDGDRRSDVSVFRPSTGVWYVLRSSNGSFTATSFGIASDRIAPADIDGDGKTDHVVFRPSDGTWHMLAKGLNYSARQFGTTGDIPVPGDYNGDGKDDLAVFRPSTGVWYIANSDSQGTFSILQFGLNGDEPVPGDYDGDGKDDLAVYRPATGVWYVLRSSDGGFYAVQFGIETDEPAQADYDGDGKTDFAVYRDGVWYLLQSTAGFTAFQFGIAEDVPSAGDFDGDGKADAAVFRPSTGVWYVLQTTGGFYVAQFGLTGDRPVPNAYFPAN